MPDRRHRGPWARGVVGLLLCLSCRDATVAAPVDDPNRLSGNPADFRWVLPAGVTPPPVPGDNPMSPAKVELGRRLFYDTRLSINGAFSCASCHRQEFAFADARNVSVGATGEAHPRNSIGLANVGYQRTLGWAAPTTNTLEQHAPIPMFGDTPVEMGLQGREVTVETALQGVALYRQLFATAFPGEREPVTMANVVKSIAAFQRTLISFDAPVDRYRRGDTRALDAAAVRGMALFDAKGCTRCHADETRIGAGGPGAIGSAFANTGLYNVGGSGGYPRPNRGLYETTARTEDMGRMKVPSLRNVGLTFPYGHDGSVGSLEALLDNYVRGGRLVRLGPNAGDGRDNPFKDPRITPFSLSAVERSDLLAFLRALKDSAFVTDPRFANPWR